MNFRLTIQIYAMEIRKAFAYRMDFWLSFFVSTLSQFAVAWFLWKSIFTYTGKTAIGNYSFASLMFYYLLAPIIGRTVYGGNFGDIAVEIYQGTLTRYLVYPVSFFRYKLIVHLANASVLLMQLLGTMAAALLIFPSLGGMYHLSPLSVVQGIVTTAAGAVLYYLFSSWIQLIAFWADQVWSLSAIVRFITGLLGGSLIPLSLFPPALQPLLGKLPFSFFIHFPLQCFLGNVPPPEWLRGMAVLSVWCALFGIIYAAVWQRGNLSYTGVGI